MVGPVMRLTLRTGPKNIVDIPPSMPQVLQVQPDDKLQAMSEDACLVENAQIMTQVTLHSYT